MHTKNEKFLIGGVTAESLAKKYGTPIYVYDEAIIRRQGNAMRKSFPGARIFYACKANTNPAILRIIRSLGIGIETVSRGEIEAAKEAGFPASDTSFTCSNVEEEDLVFAAKERIAIHLDSIHQLEVFGKRKLGREVSLRLNQGIGGGHHAHVITGGPDSKFGIDISLIKKAKHIAKKYKLAITGLQQHIGSNVPDVATLIRAMDVLLSTAKEFPDLARLDFGGGFGVPYRPEEKQLDIAEAGRVMTKRFKSFRNDRGRGMEMSIKPGRYLVAQSGYLLTKIVDIKKNPSKTFVGVNSGFNHLVRPTMYGSYHEIINASRTKGKKEVVNIAGNICESGDVFAKDRKIIMPRLGDILVICNAGAYGYTMASFYNSRLLPTEILVSGRISKVIRKSRIK